MQFLLLARRRTESFTPEQFDAVLEAEANEVRRLYTSGEFRAAWSRTDVLGAVVLIEAADLAAAEKIVAALPLAQKGMLDAQVLPLLPYRGFAPR
ncbi:MAG: muconolactone Delta-isomerase family protein [Candidatus Dormibacteria bacterium]